MIYFIALILALPILATFFVYFITYKITQHKAKSFHRAVDVTTLLYIGSTAQLLQIVFERSFISIIISILLIVLIILIIYQWKVNTEIIFRKAFKVAWRIYFLFFVCLYVVLIFYGILQRIIFF